MPQVPHALQFFNGTAVDSAVGFSYFSTSSGLHKATLTNFTNSNFTQTKDVQLLFQDKPGGVNSFDLTVSAAGGVDLEIAGPKSNVNLTGGATLSTDGDTTFDHIYVQNAAIFNNPATFGGGAILPAGLGSTAFSTINSGLGDPNTQVAANPGSLFMRLDGGTGTTLYVKESGTDETGWVAK